MHRSGFVTTVRRSTATCKAQVGPAVSRGRGSILLPQAVQPGGRPAHPAGPRHAAGRHARRHGQVLPGAAAPAAARAAHGQSTAMGSSAGKQPSQRATSRATASPAQQWARHACRASTGAQPARGRAANAHRALGRRGSPTGGLASPARPRPRLLQRSTQAVAARGSPVGPRRSAVAPGRPACCCLRLRGGWKRVWRSWRPCIGPCMGIVAGVPELAAGRPWRAIACDCGYLLLLQHQESLWGPPGSDGRGNSRSAGLPAPNRSEKSCQALVARNRTRERAAGLLGLANWDICTGMAMALRFWRLQALGRVRLVA